MKKNTV